MLRASTLTCGPGKAIECLQLGPNEQVLELQSTARGWWGWGCLLWGCPAPHRGLLPLTAEAAPFLAGSLGRDEPPTQAQDTLPAISATVRPLSLRKPVTLPRDSVQTCFLLNRLKPSWNALDLFPHTKNPGPLPALLSPSAPMESPPIMCERGSHACLSPLPWQQAQVWGIFRGWSHLPLPAELTSSPHRSQSRGLQSYLL